MDAINSTLIITLFWFILGILGGFTIRVHAQCFKYGYLFSSLGSLVLLLLSVVTFNETSSLPLAIGIPGYLLHFYQDPLSTFFISLLSVTSISTALVSSEYFNHEKPRVNALLFFHYHWFLASMVWVFLAADAYTFMLAWESMALSSYCLIVTGNSSREASRAAFLYLVMTHLGALFLMVGFGLLTQSAQGYSFEGMRTASLSAEHIIIVTLCIMIGFGSKAGLLPLHIWLPEAHPAAPSPVSALMSAVMLKTAVYGMIRLSFDILSPPTPFWGYVLMIVGVGSGLFAIIMAALQTDIKKLLAYSSIENMGIMFAGLGLSLVLTANAQPEMAALAFCTVLFHAFSHAVYKSLLFLTAGTVFYATGERQMDKLGGLIHLMPWTAACGLVGALSVAGVPPFNGFISEWLLLQIILFFPPVSNMPAMMLMPVLGSIFALIIGLCAYVMVKLYGMTFLGKSRKQYQHQPADQGWLVKMGLSWLAFLCIAIGVFPEIIWNKLAILVAPTLTPLGISESGYNPALLIALFVMMLVSVYFLIQFIFKKRLHRGPAWDCGFPNQTALMQDTPQGFSQPIQQVFQPMIDVNEMCPSPTDTAPAYHLQINDRWWRLMYQPVILIIMTLSKGISRWQHGRLNLYLLYSFATLIILLWWTL